MKICIFERSNEKSHFSKTKIYFHKKPTPQLLENIGQQNMKVGEKANFGRLAIIFKIFWWMLTSSLNNFFLSSSFYQPSCVLFSAEAVGLLSFSFTSFISISILSIVSLKFLSITLLMFSSESENFKRYAHFHKQIYITASR